MTDTKAFMQFEEDLFARNKHLPYEIYSEWRDGVIDSLMKVAGVKKHTIRAGEVCKPGDVFSPRVWSGRPYASKQICIGPDIVIKRVVKIEIAQSLGGICLDGKWIFRGYEKIMAELAKNDGLSVGDFKAWFDKTRFTGQIRIWDDTGLSY